MPVGRPGLRMEPTLKCQGSILVGSRRPEPKEGASQSKPNLQSRSTPMDWVQIAASTMAIASSALIALVAVAVGAGLENRRAYLTVHKAELNATARHWQAELKELQHTLQGSAVWGRGGRA